MGRMFSMCAFARSLFCTLENLTCNTERLRFYQHVNAAKNAYLANFGEFHTLSAINNKVKEECKVFNSENGKRKANERATGSIKKKCMLILLS